MENIALAARIESEALDLAECAVMRRLMAGRDHCDVSAYLCSIGGVYWPTVQSMSYECHYCGCLLEGDDMHDDCIECLESTYTHNLESK